MAYWNGAGYGGIAVPCPANINKTLKRRLQRKHTQQSYRQMKEKLLSFLKPMPIAAYAADLEQFRLKIYANSDDDLSTREPDCNRCQWCGIWMPLPNARIIATEVREASSTSVAEPVEDLCTIITTVVKEATPEPDPLTGQLEKVGNAVDELLELSLCQATFGQSSALDEAPRPLREHADARKLGVLPSHYLQGFGLPATSRRTLQKPPLRQGQVLVDYGTRKHLCCRCLQTEW